MRGQPRFRKVLGVEHLQQFVKWARGIGAKVNSTCGCHITVGVKSIIGPDGPRAISEYARWSAGSSR
jgi:hypothetical protein